MAYLKIGFLDVGHGDFIYCETPLGDNMVIDCCSGEVVPSEFLKNIHKINELQITHPHTDHFDDIINLSSKTIDSFRCPSTSSFKDELIGWRNSDKEKIKKLKELERSIPVNNNAVRNGSNFTHSVWTSPILNTNDPNTSSLVTLLNYNGFKILFGGDLPKEGWIELLKDNYFKESIQGTTIFKTPHHGRENGFCLELFKVISPKLCIVCDKPLDGSNENTAVVEKYSNAVKNNGGGIEFFNISDGKSVGIRYVLTTRSDDSIFCKIESLTNYLIRTKTTWLYE